MSLSDYLEGKIIDHMLRAQAYSAPAAIYLALFTVTPDDTAASGTEVAGDAYARQEIVLTAAAGAGSTANTADITFPVATPGAWGEIVAVGVFDDDTGGNMLIWGPMNANKTVEIGDQLKFAAGAITLTLD